jgi:hypothetical protein
MVMSSSGPQPHRQQNGDNNNISHATQATWPHTANRRQELQDALDGRGPTTSGTPNERQMPQHPLDGSTFTEPASAEQRPTLQPTFHPGSQNERQIPQHPLHDATFTVPASGEQHLTLQSIFPNAPGFPYFATFQYPWHNPTVPTYFPMVQTPTMNAIQPAGPFFFMYAFVPVVPLGIIQTQMPTQSNQLYRGSGPTQFINRPDEMAPPTTVLPQQIPQGHQPNVLAATHRGQRHLGISGPMGSHGSQAPENNSVQYAIPHPFYSNGGISMITDLCRISQDRNLDNLSATQYMGISRNTRFGKHQGNILPHTYSTNPPSSSLESTHQNQQRSGSSPHSTSNIIMSPTTYFGQHMGNISSLIHSYRHPYSGPSGSLTSDVFAGSSINISQHPVDISMPISYQHSIEHNDLTHHNLQSNGPSGIDIQNSGTRSTHSTGKNATNNGNGPTANISGHVGEVTPITDPINYSISSTYPSPPLLNWVPRATSTPISAYKISTSRKWQSADHHMNAASGKSIPAHPVTKTGAHVTFAPKKVPSSGPERAAAASTLPSERMRGVRR